MKIFLFLFLSLLPPLACYAQEKSVCLVITEARIQTGFLVDTDLVLTTAKDLYKPTEYWHYLNNKVLDGSHTKGVVLFGNPSVLFSSFVEKIVKDLKVNSVNTVCEHYNCVYRTEVSLYPITTVSVSDCLDRETGISNLVEVKIDRNDPKDDVPIEIISAREAENEIAECDGINHLEGCTINAFGLQRYKLNYIPYFNETYRSWNEKEGPCLKLFRCDSSIDRELTLKQRGKMANNPHFDECQHNISSLKKGEFFGSLVCKTGKAYGIMTEVSNRYVYSPMGHRYTRSVYTVTPLWLPQVQKGLRWVSKALKR